LDTNLSSWGKLCARSEFIFEMRLGSALVGMRQACEFRAMLSSEHLLLRKGCVGPLLAMATE
jgi:hypothetical protein